MIMCSSRSAKNWSIFGHEYGVIYSLCTDMKLSLEQDQVSTIWLVSWSKSTCKVKQNNRTTILSNSEAVRVGLIRRKADANWYLNFESNFITPRILWRKSNLRRRVSEYSRTLLLTVHQHINRPFSALNVLSKSNYVQKMTLQNR